MIQDSIIYDLDYKDSNRKLKYKTYHLWRSKKEPNTENAIILYKIINYDKLAMCFDESLAIRQYRSVVYSYPENQLLSFSPPRATPIETFCENYKLLDQDIQINEFIEGIMIHMFYDHRTSSWEIATKNAVGGNYHLIHKNEMKEKQKSKDVVRNMFLESLGLKKGGKMPAFESLHKDCNYCFVLQHPDNPIIMSCSKPNLYLVSVYDVICEDRFAKLVPQYEYEGWKCFQDIPKIRFPKTYQFSNYAECTDSIAPTRVNYSVMGYNLTNIKTGERTVILNKIYSTSYLMYREPEDIHYVYLCMKHIQKTKEFLKQFPKYKKMFSKFYEQYQQFINNIHSAYLEKWVYKKKIPDKYVRYVDRLHKEIYIPSVKNGAKSIITKDVIYKFINDLEPEEVLYAMNYDRREFLRAF